MYVVKDKTTMGLLSPKLSFLLSNTVNLGNWMKSSFYNTMLIHRPEEKLVAMNTNTIR